MKRLLLALGACLLGLAAYLYAHLGAYRPVEVALEKRGPLLLLFADHRGAYHQIVPVIQRVESWASEHNVRCPQTFGEYLDNPEAVDQDRLRSHGGCVLLSPLPTTPPDFQYQQRPERTYAVARFAGSPAIGPFKVYPRVRQFLVEKRLTSSSPVLELYTIRGEEMATEYLFAIDNPPEVSK